MGALGVTKSQPLSMVVMHISASARCTQEKPLCVPTAGFQHITWIPSTGT